MGFLTLLLRASRDFFILSFSKGRFRDYFFICSRLLKLILVTQISNFEFSKDLGFLSVRRGRCPFLKRKNIFLSSLLRVPSACERKNSEFKLGLLAACAVAIRRQTHVGQMLATLVKFVRLQAKKAEEHQGLLTCFDPRAQNIEFTLWPTPIVRPSC